jgi:hypothetical protein
MPPLVWKFCVSRLCDWHLGQLGTLCSSTNDNSDGEQRYPENSQKDGFRDRPAVESRKMAYCFGHTQGQGHGSCLGEIVGRLSLGELRAIEAPIRSAPKISGAFMLILVN